MTAEVDWVLDTVADNWSTAYDGTQEFEASVVKRVNRDTSDQMDDDIRSRKGDLSEAVFVGASAADAVQEAIGTEYDHRVEMVVGVRIEGLHADEYGLVDPDGADGEPWRAIVGTVRRALLMERSYPEVPDGRGTYHDLLLMNEASASSEFRDYFRTDIDVVFRGFEDLP